MATDEQRPTVNADGDDDEAARFADCDPNPMPTADNAAAGPSSIRQPNNAKVEGVAVKLPVFWPEEPEVWFLQVEAQFELAGIKTESTKFYHIISQLDQRYAREVKDLIRRPPKDLMYTRLKSELIKRLSSSREQQVRQLLTHEELGDRKPSQFLRHLRTLAAEGVSDDFLRSLWSSRLPTHVQAIIASQSFSSLDEVADLADRICEVTPCPPAPHHQVAAATSCPIPNLEGMFDRIKDMVSSQIALQLAQLDLHDSRGRSASRKTHSRHNDRSVSRGPRRSRTRAPGVCWYHSRFGENATKCTTPCTFVASENKKDSQ